MHDSLAPGATFGNYHIVRPIGGGGMAQIYLAKTRGLAGFEKHLALKVISPEYATEERFIRMLIDEAKITVGLSHVNIAQVFDLGQVEGIYYIAMEYVDGLDVLEFVNGLHALGERLPIEAVAYIGRQICSGLHYAHTRKEKSGRPLDIVHRDISPQNIIVSRNGEVKVVDFGIAKAAGVSSRTQAGVIKGKVNYMAPEQALGQKADCRTDIFAAGIVMWEMLTSQMVYNSPNMGDLVAAVRKANIPPPSSARREIPPALDAVVLKALARRPEDRYPSAHELQIALTKFLSATAPEYSGSQLSRLVERVLRRGPDQVDSSMSREELLVDRHSLISGLEGAGRPYLVMSTGEAEEIFELVDDELIVGRAGQLAISDVRVSRQHARILRRGEEHTIEDLGSSNGTFVNEEKIAGARTLRDGDKIRVGSVELTYFAGVRADAPAAAPAAAPLPEVPAVQPAPAAHPAAAPPRAASQQERARRDPTGRPGGEAPERASGRAPAGPSAPQRASGRAPAGPSAPERAGRRAPAASETKLVVAEGDKLHQHTLGESTVLRYAIQLGPLRLEGGCARVFRKDDAYWIEPLGDRVEVRLRGAPLTAPARLAAGDVFQIASLTFRLAHETRPFGAVAGRSRARS